MDLNSFSKNPRFTDIHEKRFEITEESPAIDAGTFVGILEDMYGTDVPIGQAPDIGSYETNYGTQVENNLLDHNRIVEVFPNPTTGRINIDVRESKLLEKVEIINTVGKPVQYFDLNGLKEIVIDLSQESPGLYLVRFTCSNNESIIKKIILK
jgi:hypothetical protein